MAEYGFWAPAKAEELVYGAQRPGFPGKFVQKQVVDEWLAYMKKQVISRVICMLSEEELGNYPTLTGGLLGMYTETFGQDNILWAPTPDKRLLSGEAIRHICHFLHAAVLQGEKTVVHSSAGIGRTGLALAAWLVYYHNLSERKAVRAVEELNRSPMEAVFYRNASEAELLQVLGVAREMDKLA
jgi:protein-tyrosine phosphatase